MAKSFPLKSTFSFGNLPIYAGVGAHTDAGCKFVINSKIIYEYGRVQLKFSNQNEPNIIKYDGAYPPELEMDIANIIRLKTALKNREVENPTSESRTFLLIGSSTSVGNVGYQKPAYVRFTEDVIVFNLMHNGSQSIFEINGKYQIETFIEYLEEITKVLISSTQSFDFYKNHGIGSLMQAPENIPNQAPADLKV